MVAFVLNSRSRTGTILLALAMALCGACASSTLRMAQRAFDAGDYERAAAYYALESDHAAHEASLTEKLWLSRALALRDTLRAFETAQLEGPRERAMRQLLHALRLRQTWYVAENRELPARTAERLKKALTWASAVIGEDALRELGLGRPLAAESVLDAQARMFTAPELRVQAQSLRMRIGDAGRVRCSELRERGEVRASPYLARVVSAYCLHFGEPELAEGTRAGPEQVSQISVHVSWNGRADTQDSTIQSALEQVLSRTPWFHPRAQAEAELRLAGQLESTHNVVPAVREAPWFEQVPYQDQESYLFPVDEPYLESESYREQVPYTDYERREEACHDDEQGGTGTGSSRLCTHTFPVTRYRSEERTRLVTKHRTRYETRYRTVTRHRDEPRVFRYEVSEHTAQYRGECHGALVTGALGDAFSVHWADTFTLAGDQHDVVFVPAGVMPQRPALLSDAEWLERASSILPEVVERAAWDAWLQRFCSPSAPADAPLAHAAARCAYGAHGRTPSWADGALRTLLNDDFAQVARLALPSR
jgi:hypothetical protein